VWKINQNCKLSKTENKIPLFPNKKGLNLYLSLQILLTKVALEVSLAGIR